MASEQAAAGSCPTAQVVGHAFVHQYYHILHQSPNLVFRFYQDSSKLGRPGADGGMSIVTTTQEINEKILSMDYSGLMAEIKTVDAQDSLNGGVLVLVSGELISKDNGKRNFTQSFFLAPQDRGYYVLNDIFRYVEEVGHPVVNNRVANNVNEEVHEELPTQPAPIQESHVVDQGAHMSEEDHNGEEVYNPSDDEEGSVVDEEPVVEEVVDEHNSEQQHSTDSTSSSALEEAPKKSYASIVKVMKESSFLSPSPASSPAKHLAPERQVVPTSSAAPLVETSVSSLSAVENSSVQEAEAADGHSIYIKGLPFNATSSQLEEEFRRFGPIKSGGVQVRSNKQQGFCFGFVEFESSSSVQSAIEASPLTIGGRQAYVEEKRPSSSRVARGRFPSGRGGFRNDGLRGGRGNYGGGRSYGRGDFSYRSDFAYRIGQEGSSNRGGEGGYQRVDHAGNGGSRVNRAGSFNMNGPTKAVAPRVSAPA